MKQHYIKKILYFFGVQIITEYLSIKRMKGYDNNLENRQEFENSCGVKDNNNQDS